MGTLATEHLYAFINVLFTKCTVGKIFQIRGGDVYYPSLLFRGSNSSNNDYLLQEFKIATLNSNGRITGGGSFIMTQITLNLLYLQV